MPDALRQLPLFTGPPLGVGMLSAALILAIMVIPFTSSVAREVLKSVPVAQREGAYALGATRFEAIRAALFYARTGIVGAVMLGFGRALGETMAVTMVIGNNPQVSLSLFAPQYTMAAVIANEFTEAADELYLSRADRDRSRAVHHHADRELAVAAADLEHGAQRGRRPTAEPAAAPSRRPHDPHRAPQARCRRCSSRSARPSVLIALVPLAFILFFVVSQGIQALNLEFFTHMPKPVGEAGGGMANAIVGTLILTGLASLMAIPIGILSGIYMSEYAGTPLRVGGAVRRRHAERRAVDRHRRVRLRHRGAAVQAVQRAWPAGSRSAS